MTVMGKVVRNCLKIGLVAAVAPFAVDMDAKSASIQIGVLSCTVAGGVGFIFGSSKSLSCVFGRSDGGSERYTGTIRKFGVDIGYTNRSYISWAVFAPSQDVRYGGLEGGYIGLSAEATLGAGLGANAMIGGFDKSFALQPLSVQAQSGLNIAGGIGSLSLYYAGR